METIDIDGDWIITSRLRKGKLIISIKNEEKDITDQIESITYFLTKGEATAFEVIAVDGSVWGADYIK